jgi:hypothetical protein
MAANLVSFAPFSTIAPEARALQDKCLAPIQAGIDSGSYPPGLRKQYALQLEHIEAQIPSCEVILVPVYSFEDRKRKTRLLLLIPVCLNPVPKSCPGSQQEICVHEVYDESPSISWLHCTHLFLSSSSLEYLCLSLFSKHIKVKTSENPVIDPHYFRREFGNVTLAWP